MTRMLIAALVLTLGACGTSSPGGDAGGMRSVREEGRIGRPTADEASVVHVSETDYDKLWESALEVIEPFGFSVREKVEGRIESRDFGRIEGGIPRYGYIEAALVPGEPGRYRVVVLAHRFEKRYPSGAPVGREDEPFEWVYAGLNRELQDDIVQTVFRTYLAKLQ